MLDGDELVKIKNGKFITYWNGEYTYADKGTITDCKINNKSVSSKTYINKVRTFQKNV